MCGFNLFYLSRHELTQAENIKKPPAGKHSVKGIGKTEPSPQQSIFREDGVEIPLGKGVQVDRQTSLLYNEYPFLIVDMMLIWYRLKGNLYLQCCSLISVTDILYTMLLRLKWNIWSN